MHLISHFVAVHAIGTVVACWNRARASLSWRAWKNFMAASKLPSCFGPSWTGAAAARGAGVRASSGALTVLDGCGLVIRLSVFLRAVGGLFFSGITASSVPVYRTISVYTRPQRRRATRGCPRRHPIGVQARPI